MITPPSVGHFLGKCLGCLTACIMLLAPCSAAEKTADIKALSEPILFCKRFNYQGLHIYDTFYQWRPGGGIYVLENPSAPKEQQRVRAVIDPRTPETLGEGIYFDPSLSYDAKKILFCFKGAAHAGSAIYEIGLDGKGLRQLTHRDKTGKPMQGDKAYDVKPCYLPDGRIVFTSTRYGGLVPCANNGVAILHVMNADGQDIHSISVNNVTEFDPWVMPDGRILFGRWEYVDRNALVIQSLWTIMPDGRNETSLFANNMVFPEATLQAKTVPGNDHLIVATFTPHNAPPRGTIAMIDTRMGKNNPGAIYNFEYPDKPTFDRGDSCDPWPLNENVVLYSGVPQEKDAPKIPAAAPGFRHRNNPKLNALMLIDRTGQRVVVHSDPTIDLHNPIIVKPRELPRPSPDMVDHRQRTGKFFVGNVYAGMPQVPRGSVKWLRVVEETSRISPTPGSNGLNQTFSISAAMAWSAKIYHGIVPVEPDGSVYFEAPAGRALSFHLLDQDYRLVRAMRTFVQAAPGITRSCIGCHEYDPKEGRIPHLAVNRKPDSLRDESWGSGFIDYSARIQPILDAKCVSCHGGSQGIAAGLDLSRGWTDLFNISYENLTARREKMYAAELIAGICCMNGTAYYSCKVFDPYGHGSGKAPLADILLKDPHKNLLNRTEREQVFAWIDSNGMYFGTWDFTKAGPVSNIYRGAVAKVKEVMKEARCTDCHADARGTFKRFDHWINLDMPVMSRVLRAPLPASTTADKGYGLALCRERKVDQTFSRRGLIFAQAYAHAVMNLDAFPTQKWPTAWPPEGKPVTSFDSVNNPYYQKILNIIEEARKAQLANPRIDMPNAEVIGGGIIEGKARHILPQLLPTPLPSASAAVDENGLVRIKWESSARMLGLTAEIHRGPDAAFEPQPTSQIGQTTRFEFCDRTPLQGKNHYAIVFVSEDCNCCDTCRTGTAKCETPGNPATPALANGTGQVCPLPPKPARSAPVRLVIEVTRPKNN